MTWLSKAWEWLVAAAVAIPMVAALYLWGQRWKVKAEAAESGRQAAWQAAHAATARIADVRKIRELEATARKVLTLKNAARKARIEYLEREVASLREGAERINGAFELDGAEVPEGGGE